MNIWHKRFVILQIILLLSVSAVIWFFPQFQIWIFPILCVFFFAEMGVLESQRKENPELVYYKKGCFFAMVDLLSVLTFLGVYIILIINYFFGKNLDESYFPILFLYIAIRKFYITKNYTYEK